VLKNRVSFLQVIPRKRKRDRWISRSRKFKRMTTLSLNASDLKPLKIESLGGVSSRLRSPCVPATHPCPAFIHLDTEYCDNGTKPAPSVVRIPPLHAPWNSSLQLESSMSVAHHLSLPWLPLPSPLGQVAWVRDYPCPDVCGTESHAVGCRNQNLFKDPFTAMRHLALDTLISRPTRIRCWTISRLARFRIF